MSDIEALKAFLMLPLESADAVFNKFADIPGAIRCGDGLEQFLFIPGTRTNRVLLVAHADTFWDELYGRYVGYQPRGLVEDNGVIRNIQGGLGADDRAGCALVWLLRDMGHSILITNGEEQRQKGSNYLMNHHRDIADQINFQHQFVIQVDRRNGRDFKCYSVGTDEFRAYVSRVTGFSEPDRRSYTDIVALCRNICGVNLSIGYYNEHTEDEYLVVSEWKNTLNLCRRWLSEDKLPRFSRNHRND